MHAGILASASYGESRFFSNRAFAAGGAQAAPYLLTHFGAVRQEKVLVWFKRIWGKSYSAHVVPEALTLTGVSKKCVDTSCWQAKKKEETTRFCAAQIPPRPSYANGSP